LKYIEEKNFDLELVNIFCPTRALSRLGLRLREAAEMASMILMQNEWNVT
jgi:hypothetical protein